MDKKKQSNNVTFEPIKNLSKKKFWLTILSIVFALIALALSFLAESSINNNILFVIPMVIFSLTGFIIHQKTYSNTLKTNNLAQTSIILNLLV